MHACRIKVATCVLLYRGDKFLQILDVSYVKFVGKINNYCDG